jgi:hypothetical protein
MTSSFRNSIRSIKRVLSWTRKKKNRVSTPTSPPPGANTDEQSKSESSVLESPEILTFTPEEVSTTPYLSPRKPLALELEHNVPYNVLCKSTNRYLTLEKTDATIIRLLEEIPNSKQQQWIMTEEGYIQSCVDTSVVLEVREGKLGCGRRTCTPLEIIEDGEDEVVSQHFDVVHGGGDFGCEKIIQLSRNRKMVLGKSNKDESKLALHPLGNIKEFLTHTWLFRPV